MSSPEDAVREPTIDEVLDMIDEVVPDVPVCPNCYHRQSMHDFVKVKPAAPTCSCVHPFHSQPPQGETGRELNARLARDFDRVHEQERK